MKSEILKMVVALKSMKKPVSTVEVELGFSNGIIGKAAKGVSTLSDEKFEKLKEYFNEVCGVGKISDPIPQMVITKKGHLSLAPSSEKLKRLQETMESLNKDYGQGSVMILGEKPKGGIDFIPTGSLSLNEALGIGGLPKGRMVEIYGPESSGKTTVALHIIAEAQKLGGICAFIDAEHAFDESYAKAIGVDTAALRISQPDYGEQALEEADRLIMTGAFSVVVIDSVAALVPKAELEGEMGDSKLGLQARLMSQACRKLTGAVSKTGTILIFINQLRSTIGNMYVFEVTTGGNALKYYSSVRLDVRRSGKLVDGDEQFGNKTKVKVVKNKVAPPFKVAEFDIIFGEGIDYLGEVVDTCVTKGVIKKSGAWFSYGGKNIGQGKEAVRSLLKDNPDFLSQIESELSDLPIG